METFTITTSFGGAKGVTGQRFRGIAKPPEWSDPEMRKWLLQGVKYDIHEPDPWLAQITWEVGDGEARPIRFEVRGRNGQSIDPAQTFRGMATVIANSRLQLGYLHDALANLWESHGYSKPAAFTRRQVPKSTRGNATLPEGHFPLVAALYTEYRDEPAVHNPVQAVAAQLLKFKDYENEANGDQKSWLNRVNTWVNRAKKMGLVPPAKGKNDG
ncbi:hypothetical protein GCM10027404_00920 [Arthrobacter tumbae]|uniref:hypothetical protein n=1 Tax=Arthrobacter tumbae TaxID=163874 RepID=UPI00195A550B|nr:hypothetical protein [Arthrobacter tumbae]MBM7780464.1 hypothetical protein [Arthrobacter tumbae]